MEINVDKLKKAIKDAKTITLEGNKKWMTESEQNIARIAISNFLIELIEILPIND